MRTLRAFVWASVAAGALTALSARPAVALEPVTITDDWMAKFEADMTMAAELQLQYDFRDGPSHQPATKRKGGFLEGLGLFSVETYNQDRVIVARLTVGVWGIADSDNGDIAQFFGGASEHGYDYDIAIQEAWVQYGWSEGQWVRVGVQQFNSDFAGLIYNDSDLGIVYHGSVPDGQLKGLAWNAAYFAKTYDDPMSQLNEEHFRPWHVVILNTYIPVKVGIIDMTVEPSVHVSIDKTGPTETEVVYLGAAAAGMVGDFRTLFAYYWVYGKQEGGIVNPSEQTVNAHMAIADVGYPIRAGDIEVFPHAGIFYASGDPDPMDDQAEGFDAIYDYVEAWGFNHFVIRNRINLGRGSLAREHSGLFTFRGYDENANFVNPGIIAANLGVVTKWTEQFSTDMNAGPAFLPRDDVPELVLGREVGNEVGWAFNASGTYKFKAKVEKAEPEVSLIAGVCAFVPQDGSKDIFGGSDTAWDVILMVRVKV